MLVAVLTTIFSTTLMVIDGFPRVIDRCLQNLGGRPEPGRDIAPGRGYWVTMVVFGLLTILGLSFFSSGLTPMIDFATIFTFAITPILGYLNLRAVTSDDVPSEARPGRAMLVVSYLGMVLLGGTTVVYLISRLLG